MSLPFDHTSRIGLVNGINAVLLGSFLIDNSLIPIQLFWLGISFPLAFSEWSTHSGLEFRCGSFGFFDALRMLAVKSWTNQLLRSIGIGLSLFDLFFFGSSIALFHDFLVPLGIGRKSDLIALDGGIGSDHQ